MHAGMYACMQVHIYVCIHLKILSEGYLCPSDTQIPANYRVLPRCFDAACVCMYVCMYMQFPPTIVSFQDVLMLCVCVCVCMYVLVCACMYVCNVLLIVS